MDADAIFDAIGKASMYISLQDKRQEKISQIRSVNARRCGNCWHWMKTSCKPEKAGKQFKSMNSFACKDFALNDNGLTEVFTKELDEIDKRIAEHLLCG